MRWSLLAMLAPLLAVPAAQGDLAVAVEAPQAPVAVDGSGTVRLTLSAGCDDLLPRLDASRQATVAVAWTVDGLDLQGPASLAFEGTDCLQDPLGRQDIVQDYTVNGSRDLPGLVPIVVSVAAAFPDAPLDAVRAEPGAGAAFNVTPRAIVDYELIAADLLPAGAGASVAVPVQVLTRSNVELVFHWSAVARQSTRNGEDGALPFGDLVPPEAGWRVPRGLSAEPVLAATVAQYAPPRDGDGVDRFVLDANPQVALDPSWAVPGSSLELELSYAVHDGETVVGIDQTAHNPRPAATPLLAPVVVGALAIALLLRRR